MGRVCALALALLVLVVAAAPADAQNSTFGETQLNGTGPVYKKQDSLDPVRVTHRRPLAKLSRRHSLILRCLV